MRVCIPIEFKPHGGGHYFLKSFADYLVAHQHWVTQDVRDHYDVLFTNHWMVPHREILKAFRHNPRVRVVQRIDGAAQDYGRDPEADLIQHQVNLLADLTIFQSEYCRYSTREKFPVIVEDGPLIHNPVDVDVFTPEGRKRSFPHKTLVAAVTWSTNPMKGSASVYEVARSNPEVGFVLCGNFPNAPNLSNVHALGVLGREELAKVLRSCDVLVTFSQNEACPNHVLEALASGLPVLYIDSGAMREIVGDGGASVTVSRFSSQLARILQDKARYSKAARRRAVKHFSPQKIFVQYVDVIERTIELPAKLSIVRRLASAYFGL